MKKNKKKKVAAKKRPVAKKKIIAKNKRPIAKKRPVTKKKKLVAKKKPFGKLRAKRKISRKPKSIIDISKEKFDYFMAKIAAI